MNEIGGNPLSLDLQEKLGELMDYIEANYEIDQGSTALYWFLSYQIASKVKPKSDHKDYLW